MLGIRELVMSKVKLNRCPNCGEYPFFEIGAAFLGVRGLYRLIACKTFDCDGSCVAHMKTDNEVNLADIDENTAQLSVPMSGKVLNNVPMELINEWNSGGGLRC